ncbi:MAG: Npun_F5749 family FMN-dependent PPOX-type flavoprotein [Microcystaceae cyanobacterium]
MLAPWRSHLKKALHLNRSQVFSRYFQLATVTSEGKPTNRTVVFRGFLNDSNTLQIVTDTRSDKFNHLQYNPLAEICWYFTKTREQFRLSGKIELVTDNHDNPELVKARQILWQNLSDAAKKQFTWPFPKQPRKDNPSLFETDVNLLVNPVSHFCLLLFIPETVDHLQLKGDPQNRSIYYLNGEQTWIVESVNP